MRESSTINTLVLSSDVRLFRTLIIAVASGRSSFDQLWLHEFRNL